MMDPRSQYSSASAQNKEGDWKTKQSHTHTHRHTQSYCHTAPPPREAVGGQGSPHWKLLLELSGLKGQDLFPCISVTYFALLYPTYHNFWQTQPGFCPGLYFCSCPVSKTQPHLASCWFICFGPDNPAPPYIWLSAYRTPPQQLHKVTYISYWNGYKGSWVRWLAYHILFLNFLPQMSLQKPKGLLRAVVTPRNSPWSQGLLSASFPKMWGNWWPEEWDVCSTLADKLGAEPRWKIKDFFFSTMYYTFY